MPSHLRLHSSFEEPIEANAIYTTSPTLPPAKKQRMSLTQTYYVASAARTKLGREASRGDHNLRLLVGHANLLDSLMVELADAEREQEAWFNQSVRKAAKPEEPKHIQWIDTIAEEEERMAIDSDDSDDDADSEFDDEEDFFFNLPLRKIVSPPITISSHELDEEEDDSDMEEDDEDDDEHALERVMSKHSPPELTHDSDSESDDDSMPSSPESSTFELSGKEARSAIQTTTDFYAAHKSQGLEEYLLQQTNQPMIAAC